MGCLSLRGRSWRRSLASPWSVVGSSLIYFFIFIFIFLIIQLLLRRLLGLVGPVGCWPGWLSRGYLSGWSGLVREGRRGVLVVGLCARAGWGRIVAYWAGKGLPRSRSVPEPVIVGRRTGWRSATCMSSCVVPSVMAALSSWRSTPSRPAAALHPPRRGARCAQAGRVRLPGCRRL